MHAPEVEVSVSGAALLEGGSPQHERPSTELILRIEPVTDEALPRDVTGEVDLRRLGLEAGVEHPLFITARQRDQSRVWTSALFVTNVAG